MQNSTKTNCILAGHRVIRFTRIFEIRGSSLYRGQSVFGKTLRKI